MIGQGLLPVVFPPDADERLSSWIARMAPFYAMTVPEFLAELGLFGRDVFDLEWRLSEGEGAQIEARTGLSPRVVQGMTFGELLWLPPVMQEVFDLIGTCDRVRTFVRPYHAALPRAASQDGDQRIGSKSDTRALGSQFNNWFSQSGSVRSFCPFRSSSSHTPLAPLLAVRHEHHAATTSAGSL